MSGRARIAGWCGAVVLGWAGAQLLPATLAQGTKAKPAGMPPADDKNIVAYVNGVPITRQELGEELIVRKGKEQLKLLINRKIVEHACHQAGITVTDAEVEADLKDAIKTTHCANAAQFEETVLKQRRTTLYEYKEDVLRPAIAMRKLAGKQVEVTEEDVRNAFEATYGEQVKCHIIFVGTQREALRIYQEVKNDRDAFLRAARQHNTGHLAATGGELQIHRRFCFDNVEKAAFGLRDGEISHVMQVPGGAVILLREGLVPADSSKKLDDVRAELARQVQDQKIRQVVPELFKELRQQAVVRDYLNNKFDIKEVMTEFSNKPENKTSAAGPGRQ
jgi:foldase protein PrsA